jgi:hypothetical protein
MPSREKAKGEAKARRRQQQQQALQKKRKTRGAAWFATIKMRKTRGRSSEEAVKLATAEKRALNELSESLKELTNETRRLKDELTDAQIQSCLTDEKVTKHVKDVTILLPSSVSMDMLIYPSTTFVYNLWIHLSENIILQLKGMRGSLLKVIGKHLTTHLHANRG